MIGAINKYVGLTKPGIIRGNAITAAAGFFLASAGNVDFRLFIYMLSGICLVMASACVFNNYIDRGIDQKMARTKNRALVTGTISGPNAIIYASVLGLFGFGILFFYTNILTTMIALVGFVFYVVLYGIEKRRSTYGTLVGAVSGAVPPVVGYCAVSGMFDLAAFILFTLLVFWQMAHFYAIGIYRLKDYKSASLPILPVKIGIPAAKMHILIYIIAFTATVPLLTFYGYTGYSYLFVVILLSLVWLILAINGFKASDDNKWARKVFGISLIVLLGFSIMISVNSFLP